MPAFDEADVSAKPAVIRSIPPLDDEQIGRLEDEYRWRLASLRTIDDMVESIVNELEAAQVLERTYVMYSSDSGALWRAAARSPQICIARLAPRAGAPRCGSSPAAAPCSLGNPITTS